MFVKKIAFMKTVKIYFVQVATEETNIKSEALMYHVNSLHVK